MQKKPVIAMAGALALAIFTPFAGADAAQKLECPKGYVVPTPTENFPNPKICCPASSPYLTEQGACTSEPPTKVTTLAIDGKDKANVEAKDDGVRMLNLKEQLIARLELAHERGEFLDMKKEDIMALSTEEIQSMLAETDLPEVTREASAPPTAESNASTKQKSDMRSSNAMPTGGTGFPWGAVLGVAVTALGGLLVNAMRGGGDEASGSSENGVPATAATKSVEAVDAKKTVKQNKLTNVGWSEEWKTERAEKFLAAVEAGTVTEQVIGFDKDGYPVFEGEDTPTHAPLNGGDDVMGYSPNNAFAKQYNDAIQTESETREALRLAALPKANFEDKTLPYGHYVDQKTGKEFSVTEGRTDWGSFEYAEIAEPASAWGFSNTDTDQSSPKIDTPANSSA